ncbi:MAG TPA: hypothetical protein VGS09_06255 [Actinomycetota bacterium]|jgi:hypothetical protein|nr:hypothetical protein [Actinomycetota bacterium]
MSKLLSRHDRWELWMAATPGAQTSPTSAAQTTATKPPSVTRPEQQNGSGDLVREVERLRGVIHTAVAALSYVGAHDEASRVRAALETR